MEAAMSNEKSSLVEHNVFDMASCSGEAIGCLLYAALGTRPDIVYTIGVLGRHASDPGISHMNVVKHLFRYIKRTINYELPIYDASWTSKDEPTEHSVVAYADADFAGDLDDGKSTSGYLIYVHGILISWRSKKQTLVA